MNEIVEKARAIGADVETGIKRTTASIFCKTDGFRITVSSKNFSSVIRIIPHRIFIYSVFCLSMVSISSSSGRLPARRISVTLLS